jgi:hypothetical protein
VFAAVGWSTMLYTPAFVAEEAHFSFTLAAAGRRAADGVAKKSLEQTSRRLAGAVVRNYGLMLIACPPESGLPPGFPTLLTVTHLKFCSSSRLGDVTVTWVDDLSKQCEFDRYSRIRSSGRSHFHRSTREFASERRLRCFSAGQDRTDCEKAILTHNDLGY